MSEYVRLRRRDPVEISEGPGPLPRTWRNIAGFHNLAAEEQARHGWYPFQGEAAPRVDAHTEKAEQHLSLDGGMVLATWAVVALTEAERIHQRAERRRALLAELPAIRFRHETGGVVFDGIPLHTDRESQVTIALTALQGTAERWKGSDGKWYDLDSERLAEAAAAVIQHKRACFAREEALASEIRQVDRLEALEAIDLEEGWP